jgi:RNA polymerase sigma-70 factor (ECF subfamily)
MLTTSRKDDFDDIVQNTLLDILSGLSGYRFEASFTTWIDKITTHAVRRYYRRFLNRAWFLTEEIRVESFAAPTYQQPEQMVSTQSEMEKLRRWLDKIKPDKRIAVVLGAAYGYTAPEIAEITGCSEETAKKRIQYGRRELLAFMKKDKELSLHSRGGD